MSDNELNRMDDETPLGIQETDEDVPLGSDCLEKAKRQTFSHWPHANPSGERMAEAGFFNCNAGDRTICLECNLICHKWTPNVDNPSEVHKALSPNCAFVRAKLVRRDPPCTINVGLSSTVNPDNNSNDVAQQPLWLMCDEIAPKMSIHHQYSELPQRHDSFAQWPAGNLPSVDDLVQAGFFYTGTRTIVTCFFCNGSLQNWGPKDSPMADHARWFPHCAYARQLCGEDLFRAIQESVRVQLELSRANNLNEQGVWNTLPNATNFPNSRHQLQIPDEITLAQLVAARLDWPISKNMLGLDLTLSNIKQCWEDQLRLKRLDFLSEYDLFTACFIRQKQMEHTNGEEESIVIPSVKMREIRELSEMSFPERLAASQHTLTNPVPTTNNASVDINDASNNRNGNSCVICITAERQMACIPCGHLLVCTTCAASLQNCPKCQREIQTFVRIFN